MRNVIYSMNVSLDGFVARPDGALDWITADEEFHTVLNDKQAAVGTYLLGRRAFELMEGFWPTADQDPTAPAYIVDFSRHWKAMPKVVFSRTLSDPGGTARVVRGDAVAEVRRLKAQPGKDFSVGGPTLAASLIAHALVDEFHLFLQPVILGRGLPLLPPDVPIPLQLVETQSFASGVVFLHYRRRADGTG